MNADRDENLPVDDLLARSYEPLRAAPPGQRSAIVDGLAEALRRHRAPQRIFWNRPLAWLATAAGLAVAATTVALLVPSSTRLVYGVEAVPARLAEVQTIRQRGYWIIYPREDAHGPPVRVPIENLVKRPDKFRHTWYGVSYPTGEPMIVKRGSRICDGHSESWISQEDQHCSTGSIGLLDAWIKTETQAQEFLTTLLGPPGVPYQKIGQETIRGRACDVYEGRFGRQSEFRNQFVSKLWIDPATGYPMRSTRDEILPDGTTRRIQELEEIAVNVPLDDKLFEFAAPEGFKTVTAAGSVDPTALDSHYTSGGFGGDQKLEVWHAFRVTDNSALVVWRRSEPKENDDGTRDWLSGLTLTLFGDDDDLKRPAQHDWLYQSRSPDVWNWSLVAVEGPPLPDRGGIRLHLKTKPLDATMEMFPLRFPERGLERIVEAAVSATLPPEAPRYSLDVLRIRASQMPKSAPSQ